ncbi:hypothetical protein M885DRAFT_529810 [Pelagophyceae sp. CCMP2097]|nr:hypothetical protein M885DRAFT_529810 [Pelagophyceae sp. CCMP2097]|eukprot:CAMPEP_0184263732 /NCGR_PEP_ID=MMETSP0977-20130417/20024_1 /TAXON_ID=483370 /ORGANISM="non described non described, Strain CCMP2097" /LENGTH=191 /DNA_ID=CAMNT_0026569443 /DNA_START=1 /DNA_END=576 /DNA_ORIENTATION=+
MAAPARTARLLRCLARGVAPRVAQRGLAIGGDLIGDHIRQRVAAQTAAANAAPHAPSAPPDPLAKIPPELAHELVFEVGWESRHCFVDVRDAATFARGRARDAINIPWGADFSTAAPLKIPAELGRVVVGGAQAQSEAVTAAAAVLNGLGFTALAMSGGFETWRKLCYAIDVDGLEPDEDDGDDGDPRLWK